MVKKGSDPVWILYYLSGIRILVDRVSRQQNCDINLQVGKHLTSFLRVYDKKELETSPSEIFGHLVAQGYGI